MKNISNFIVELENLKSDMGKGKNALTQEDIKFINERKLREFQDKVNQLDEEIQREIDDLFAYVNMKQASIESFSLIKGYVTSEIKKLEQSLKELNINVVK
ncbi:hypothetical protein [Ruminiclostridium papyrosolvens]|uniref:Uncharacterized protein n=1 Tax=Ruminiclostridium papyrosolvens C7 TaxID=1330534 RepID=U4QWT3_9FIRM|nr:hypothetical protein [Ruminiclostridium papyrosolvens]EPR07786.1 hypothetical protein L323_20010 [Ruminiclostridium papyrosolvens C7]